MVQESDIVREEINETRDQLTEKLVTLEDKIRNQVETAKVRADETIENVREAVNSAIDSLSPKRQIERSPLVALGLSVGTGVLVGGWAGARLSPQGRRLQIVDRHLPLLDAASMHLDAGLEEPIEDEASALRARRPYPATQGVSLWDKLRSRFSDEIALLKSMAVQGVADNVAASLKEPFPQFSSQIDQLIDSLKRKVAPTPAKAGRRGRSDAEEEFGVPS